MITEEIIFHRCEQIAGEVEEKLKDMDWTNMYFIRIKKDLEIFTLILKTPKHAYREFTNGEYLIMHHTHELFLHYNSLMEIEMGDEYSILFFLKSPSLYENDEIIRRQHQQQQGDSYPHPSSQLHIELPQDPLPFPMPKLPEGGFTNTASRFKHIRKLGSSNKLNAPYHPYHLTGGDWSEFYGFEMFI